MAAGGGILFFEFGAEKLVGEATAFMVGEVAGGEGEGEGVFEQVVTAEVVLNLAPEVSVLAGNGGLYRTGHGQLGAAVKLQPVHEAEAGRVRFPAVAVGGFGGDPAVDEGLAGGGVKVGLAEELEVVKVVGPEFAVGGVVPVDGTGGGEFYGAVQKAKPRFAQAFGQGAGGVPHRRFEGR